MKKHFSLVLLLVFIFLVSGCGASSIAPRNSQTPENTPEITATPSIAEIASPSPSILPVSTSDSISFDEDELLKDFPFGMDGKDMEKELTKLGIGFSQDVQPDGEAPEGFSLIIPADDFDFVFHMDDHNRLFSIDDLSFATAKGLQPGDTIEQMRALLGKEDEYDVIQDEYVYNKDDYVIIFTADTRENKIDLCS
jgi:hypothetical protein